jgi:hypothetical protein
MKVLQTSALPLGYVAGEKGAFEAYRYFTTYCLPDKISGFEFSLPTRKS